MQQLHGVKMVLMVQRRFLDRVWRLFINEDGSLSNKIVENNDNGLDKVYNQTVKKLQKTSTH